MVIVAVRVEAFGFAAQVTMTVPLPLPDVGLTTAQVWLLEAVQLVLDVTVIDAVEFAG